MEVIRQVLAVLFVFAALGAALWLLRKHGQAGWRPLGRKRIGQLEAVERLALSPQHALHLVRSQDRMLLIATYPSGCSLIESNPSWRQAASDGGLR